MKRLASLAGQTDPPGNKPQPERHKSLPQGLVNEALPSHEVKFSPLPALKGFREFG
jgi:hypothetical protein